MLFAEGGGAEAEGGDDTLGEVEPGVGARGVEAAGEARVGEQGAEVGVGRDALRSGGRAAAARGIVVGGREGDPAVVGGVAGGVEELEGIAPEFVLLDCVRWSVFTLSKIWKSTNQRAPIADKHT